MTAVPKILLLLCGLAAAVYVAAVLGLSVVQRRLIYPAPRYAEPPPGTVAGFEELSLRTSDGLQLRAIYRSARGDRPTLVFFHGNGDSLRGALLATDRLVAAGYGLLLPEYRGYGGNPGAPTEAGLYRDGEAALHWLRQHHVPPGRTVLVGNSLGSGVATELATREPVAGLVLVSPFTSLADVAARHMRLLPARLLLRDRYDN